jgi:hypothetical protein
VIGTEILEIVELELETATATIRIRMRLLLLSRLKLYAITARAIVLRKERILGCY